MISGKLRYLAQIRDLQTCLPVKPWVMTLVSLLIFRLFRVALYAVVNCRAPRTPERQTHNDEILDPNHPQSVDELCEKKRSMFHRFYHLVSQLYVRLIPAPFPSSRVGAEISCDVNVAMTCKFGLKTSPPKH